MINVDLQQLVQALDAASKQDLECAAERCVVRGGSKILVEDLLLGLLERPEGLLPRALQDAEVDAGELARALQIDTLQLTPVLDALVALDWVAQISDAQDPGAWSWAYVSKVWAQGLP